MLFLTIHWQLKTCELDGRAVPTSRSFKDLLFSDFCLDHLHCPSTNVQCFTHISCYSRYFAGTELYSCGFHHRLTIILHLQNKNNFFIILLVVLHASEIAIVITKYTADSTRTEPKILTICIVLKVSECDFGCRICFYVY